MVISMMNGQMCKRCRGISGLVVGALVLVNAYLWPRWLGIDGWVTYLGLLLVVGGFIKLVIPNKCSGCNTMMCDMSSGKSAKSKK